MDAWSLPTWAARPWNRSNAALAWLSDTMAFAASHAGGAAQPFAAFSMPQYVGTA